MKFVLGILTFEKNKYVDSFSRQQKSIRNIENNKQVTFDANRFILQF